MQFLGELGLFSGKVFVLTIAIASLLILIFVLIARSRKSQPLIHVEKLNDKFDNMENALKSAVWDAKALKKDQQLTKSAAKKKRKSAAKEAEAEKRRIYVLDFKGDIRASHLENLREEVTSLLTIARPKQDEVVVKLESPGGMVHAYGLAASQLIRLRQAGLELTVSVDKVAASGGYMMACTANRILSAPFAIIGSIGVVAQVPNFHRLLKKHDVDFEEITAGEFKRTISLFGEITDKGRRKFLDQIEDTHGLFKAFVKSYRPDLDLDHVATGEYWFGQRALDLKLVDEITSSDDYLFKQRKTADIYKVEILTKKKWSERLAENVARLVVDSYEKAWLRISDHSRI